MVYFIFVNVIVKFIYYNLFVKKILCIACFASPIESFLFFNTEEYAIIIRIKWGKCTLNFIVKTKTDDNKMRVRHYGTAQLDGRRNYNSISIVLSNTVAEELKNFTKLDETTKI